MENTMVTTAKPSIKERFCNFGNKALDFAIRVYESPTTKWIVGGFCVLKLVDKVTHSDHNADLRYGDAELSLTKSNPGNS